jgi:hypothetical protein
MENRPSICATNRKSNAQIENGHFVVRVHISRQQKQLFYETNTQLRHFRVGPSQSWLENLFGIPWNFAIIPFSDLLDSGIFIGILFFRS